MGGYAIAHKQALQGEDGKESTRQRQEVVMRSLISRQLRDRTSNVTDFSRHLENAILSFFQTLIFTLAIFINLELLRISLWKKSRYFVS